MNIYIQLIIISVHAQYLSYVNKYPTLQTIRKYSLRVGLKNNLRNINKVKGKQN